MILGHDSVKKFFSCVAKRGTLAHAYLFLGPEGVGKRTFAFELANKLNNTKGFDADFKYIDEHTGKGYSIGIDEIRELKRFFSFRPYANPFKIAVINSAHLMQGPAQNAVLKLLEEPSPHSLILIVTHEPNRLYGTIRSRCQPILFRPVASQVIRNALLAKGLATEDLELIVSMANGRIGYAVAMAENGEAGRIQKRIEAFKRLRKAPLAARFDYAKKLLSEDEVDKTIYYWIGYLRRTVGGNKFLLERIMRLSAIIGNASYNKRLALENFLIHV